MVEMENFRSLLRQDGLLAIVRGTDPDACVASVRVLADAGIRLVEVSLTSTDAVDVIDVVDDVVFWGSPVPLAGVAASGAAGSGGLRP